MCSTHTIRWLKSTTYEDGEKETHKAEEEKGDEDDDVDDEDDDDDVIYVPNANKDLDFSDDEEFLVDLSDCSDEVIEVTKKVTSKWAKVAQHK